MYREHFESNAIPAETLEIITTRNGSDEPSHIEYANDWDTAMEAANSVRLRMGDRVIVRTARRPDPPYYYVRYGPDGPYFNGSLLDQRREGKDGGSVPIGTHGAN